MGRYLRAVICLSLVLIISMPSIGAGERLQPESLTYQGAFRLPDSFNWGARGLSFYPGGNSGSGTLLVTGFELLFDPSHPGESCWDPSWNCNAYYGEVAIHVPASRQTGKVCPRQLS